MTSCGEKKKQTVLKQKKIHFCAIDKIIGRIKILLTSKDSIQLYKIYAQSVFQSSVSSQGPTNISAKVVTGQVVFKNHLPCRMSCLSHISSQWLNISGWTLQNQAQERIIANQDILNTVRPCLYGEELSRRKGYPPCRVILGELTFRKVSL